MKIYTKSIEEYATDVFDMEERATCRFSQQSTIDSHIEIVKYNVKRLVQALSNLEDDTTALKDYYIQRAISIGKKYGNEDCKILSDRIIEIRMQQRRKEREEQERREEMELLQDILTEKAADLCEEDIQDMYELVEKYSEHMTEDQLARFQDIHMALAELAEDKEAEEKAERERELRENEEAIESKITCVLCLHTFEGYGHNAEPLSVGRCCSGCNEYLVIPKRIKDFFRNKQS